MATAFIKKLAVEMKSAMATGFKLEDIACIVEGEVQGACGTGPQYPNMPSVRGCFGLCDEAFEALCIAVEAELPNVRACPRTVALHRQAARDVRAAATYERQQLGLGA